MSESGGFRARIKLLSAYYREGFFKRGLHDEMEIPKCHSLKAVFLHEAEGTECQHESTIRKDGPRLFLCGIEDWPYNFSYESIGLVRVLVIWLLGGAVKALSHLFL